ncbi:MAG: PH domain-containing protein [Myxococcales bacterium]|nr:PH domain-containing protein [Myxococcales bacterium]
MTTESPSLPPDLLYEGAPSWRAFFSRYLFAALLFAGAGVAGAMAPPPANLIAAGLLLAVSLWLWAVGELRRRGTRYRVTSKTLDIEQGLLTKRIESMQMWRVRDVTFEQSLGERVLGLARVKVLGHDASTPEVVLWGLADGRALFEQLKVAVEQSRTQGRVLGLTE